MRKWYNLLLVALLTVTGSVSFAQSPLPPISILGRLVFTSRPPLTATVGVKYTYQAVAVSKDSGAVIRYIAKASVKGFAIDSVTGVFTWTPDSRGWYQISILATSNKGGRGEQDFIVEVSGGNGIVQGTVTDTLNNPLEGVIVQALSIQTIAMGPNTSPSVGVFSYAATTDKNGKYRIGRIDPGKYKFHAISPSPKYLSQWYDGRQDPALADIVTVSDTPSVTIADFKLRSGVTPAMKVTVKGFVTDTLGHPLKSVVPQVYFVSAGFALNGSTDVDDFRQVFDGDQSDDFRLDGTSAFVFQTRADSLGAYSLTLPKGSYIAYSTAPGFVTDFYLHQSDIRSANTLVLQKDSSGINFRLAAVPAVPLGHISGSVLDSSKGVGVRSRVIAIRDYWTRPDPVNLCRAYTVDTDSLGAYTFNNLVPGTYIVLAIPLGSYAPAYYTTDTTTTQWKKATKLVINGNTITGVNIYVRALNISVKGYAGMSGSIRMGNQTPVDGAIAFASFKNSVVGYAIADNNGNYQISGVSPNSYSVTVDMPGYEETSTQTANVSYLSNGSPVNSSLNFNMTQVVTQIESNTAVVPSEFVLSQNYPNPFNPTTIISYQLASNSVVTLKVFDILGREIATLVNGRQVPGTYNATFDASHLSSGVYLYQLTVNDNSETSGRGFVQTKKMILLK